MVKKAETRGHGVPSKAERPYTMREFHDLLKLLPNEKTKAFASFAAKYIHAPTRKYVGTFNSCNLNSRFKHVLSKILK